MNSTTIQVLAIANNAHIDHLAGHPRTSAPFNCAKQRAAVKRAAARGWLTITESRRGEAWAAITLAGRIELARVRGDELPTS